MRVTFSRMRTVEFDLEFVRREPTLDEFQQACSHALDCYERTGRECAGCFFLWGAPSGIDDEMGFSYRATVVDSPWSKSHAPYYVDCDDHIVDANKMEGER